MYQGPPGPGFPAPAPALVYTLLSSAPQDPITHNIMRIPDPKFNLDTMIPPVRMVREKPEPRRRREDPAAAAQAGDGTIKPEGAEGDVAPADGKEKPDTTKIAPFGNAIKTRQKRFHKKTKIYTLSRDPSLVHGPNGPPPKKYKRDPDRHPYVLSDFEGTTQYSGQVQGQTDSTYMAFVVQGGTLKAVPISKWYKFMPQAKYRTYTAEEAAEMMKKQSRKRLDTWVMHRKNKTEDGAAVNVKEEPTDVKPKEEKAYMKKLLGTDGQDMVRDGRDRKDDDAAELDFEAGFSDDEDIRFGMEDEEDEKEAKNRQYGKHGKRSGFMDDDDADDDDERGEQQRSKSSSAVGKKLKNALKKVDQADEVDLPDEENPYNSEMEDSDDDEPEPEDPDVKLEPGVKRKADGETPGGLAPGMIKKLKGDGGVSPAMSSPEYSATIGRKKKPTRSPMHPGAMSSSPLGRAGSSSPASGNSPMGSSKLGKKRKGAASSDDERSDKKARPDNRPISTGSATEMLKHLSGRAASPPHSDSSGRPSSIRAKSTIGGRPKGTASGKSTPLAEGSSMGGQASPGGQTGTPKSTGSGGGASGKRKAPAGSTGAKVKRTAQTSPLATGSSTGAPRPLTDAVIQTAFRNCNKEHIDLKELLAEVVKIAGSRSHTELRNEIQPAFKTILKLVKRDEKTLVTLRQPGN